jgi:hypothetical protein
VFALLITRRAAMQAAAMRRALETFRNKLIFSGRVRQSVSVVALFVLFVAILGGCHHSSTTGIVVTPKGTTNLTIQGTAQNATRGFTVTLVVN